MPRTRRIHLEHVIYYVSLEGLAGEPIFREPADYCKYIELLNQCKAEYQFKLFSFALLPNRICLLLEPDRAFPISKIMLRITPAYTKYHNGKYERKGPLFQKRFRSVYVEKLLYLARLTRFIHLLAEESGARNFREYPYSSYGAFAAEKSNILSISMEKEVKEVMSYLINPALDGAYERFMFSATKEEMELLSKKLARGAFLGSKDFISHVKKRLAAESEKDAGSEDMTLEKPVPFRLPAVTNRTLGLAALLAFTVAASASSVYFNHPAPSRASSATASLQVPALAKLPVKKPAQTPPALAIDLNGVILEVELISVSESGEKIPVKDKIKFSGNSFESYYFSSHGFGRSNYTVTVHENGVVTWETMQKNATGEVVSWHGDWQGGKMEGMLSYRPSGNPPQDFSFMGRPS